MNRVSVYLFFLCLPQPTLRCFFQMCSLQNSCLGSVDLRQSAYSNWKLSEGILLSQKIPFPPLETILIISSLINSFIQETFLECLSA